MHPEDSNISSIMFDNHSHYHNETITDNNIYDVLVAKAVTMITLCFVSLFMGIIPMQIAKYCTTINTTNSNPRSKRWVSLLLGFGGGVLFCTTLIHMLPEVEHGVEENETLAHFNIPLAKVLCCAGFFIMYLIEEIVHTHLRNRSSKHCHEEAKSPKGSQTTIYRIDSVENYGSFKDAECTAKWQNNTDRCEVGHSHVNVIEDCDGFHTGAIRGLLIVLGLSVHELFEGLSIGLESSPGSVWYMFGAVAAHKFIIAFCIGVELTTSKTSQFLCYAYVCLFAVVSPLGIGIGMILVGGKGAAAMPLAVVLQGLASGTLLYVVFFEILHKHRNGLSQYISILVGFLLMFGLQILTAHTHDHGHSHGHDHDHEVPTSIENDTVINEKNSYVLDEAVKQVTEKVISTLSNAMT